MSRDSRLKWSVITLLIVTDICLLLGLRLGFDLLSLLWPLGFTIVLAAVGLYYRHRREPNFVLCINALLHLVLFSSAYTVLMYACATLGCPLIDEYLVRLDAGLGCHVPAVVAWAGAHPLINRMLQLCYNTLLPQTAAVVGILGLLGDRRPLEVFLQRFMLSALLTAMIFCIAPAAGPFDAFGYPLNETQARYMSHFTALRSGEMNVLSISNAEGLITFPSFHTAWALLMGLAFMHRRVLFALAAVLNFGIVISTVTTGWHYMSDTLAGIVVCLVAMALCRLISPWIYPPERQLPAALPEAM